MILSGQRVLALLPETGESLIGASHRHREKGLPSSISLQTRMCIHNSLSVQHFHGVSTENVHECSLKARSEKSPIRRLLSRGNTSPLHTF
jgi:hypothetical protein